MDLVEAAWDEHRPPDPELIKDCVHCGFCLPTCPSYLTFEEEMDSPRGRIVLMRVGHEDAELSDEMVTHFDRCLGCLSYWTPDGQAVTHAMQPRQRSRWTRSASDGSESGSLPTRISTIRPRGESISSSKTV